MPQPKRQRITRDAQVRNKIAKGMGRINSDKPDEYVPFLLIHDFSSQGRSTRTSSGRRIFHLMSGLETMCLRELQWNPNVIAIYEQVYLPREVTTRIAEEMGVRHPTLSADGLPYPMTTDLVADIVQDGIIKQHAFAVKDSGAITRAASEQSKNPRKERRGKVENTLSILEIERRYWTAKGAAWSLVTEINLCQQRARNIERFQKTPVPPWTPPYVCKVKGLALRAISSYPNRKVEHLARALEKQHLVPVADTILALQHMCASRFLEFDLNKPFGPDSHGRDFKRGAWTSAEAFAQAAA